jgi:hypothetical protein
MTFLMKGGSKNWTSAKIFLFANFRHLPESWGRNFCFFWWFLSHVYLLCMSRRKYDSLCIRNFPFSVTSLQLCKLSHISEWLPYLLYVLILQWWWYFLGKYCSSSMWFYVPTELSSTLSCWRGVKWYLKHCSHVQRDSCCVLCENFQGLAGNGLWKTCYRNKDNALIW